MGAPQRPRAFHVKLGIVAGLAHWQVLAHLSPAADKQLAYHDHIPAPVVLSCTTSHIRTDRPVTWHVLLQLINLSILSQVVNRRG